MQNNNNTNHINNSTHTTNFNNNNNPFYKEGRKSPPFDYSFGMRLNSTNSKKSSIN